MMVLVHLMRMRGLRRRQSGKPMLRRLRLLLLVVGRTSRPPAGVVRVVGIVVHCWRWLVTALLRLRRWIDLLLLVAGDGAAVAEPHRWRSR